MTEGSRRRVPPRHRVHVIPLLRRPGGLLFRNWLAITIGRDIWTWRPLDHGELAHELEHVRQWRQHGVLYAVRYWLSSLRAVRAGGHWYRDNEFEVAARAAADAARAALDGRRPADAMRFRRDPRGVRHRNFTRE